MTQETLDTSAGRMQVPRTRGAISGFALVVLGAWGALAPFIGPYFNFAFTPQPNTSWHWTAARGWYEVLPGGVAVLGGLLLLLSANRAMTSFGAWIAIVAGGWFVVGPEVSALLTLGSPGSPSAGGQREQVAELLAFFTALGAVIVLFGALAAGRLSVRSVRDVRVATARRIDEQRAASEPVVPAEPVAPDDAVDDEAVAADEPVAADEAGANREPVTADETGTHDEPVALAKREEPAEPAGSTEQPVATSSHPDAPYAPDGHTPAADELPADATPQPGGPGYATPQRYVRREPSEQIPVEQLRRDHPTT